MPNGDYFIIGIYGLSPTFCESFRPTVHFFSSAEAFKDEVLRTPACVYGLTADIDVVAFTHRYALFATFAVCWIGYSRHSLR